ncbi:MAG: branched-chain amino acid ABC transporter permease [Betaproteobacteria bacterium]|nr:branched-chain amino acid ABC transporter permease [Betaproteobacteria bacterium]
MELLPIQFINGIAYAMILFLIASGFSLIFGTMGILNLAHGTFCMLGVYFGLSMASWSESWLLGLLAGGAGVALLGFALERSLLRRLYRQENEQVLLTLGLVYIFANLALWIWGPDPFMGDAPAILSGLVAIGGAGIPVYRLFIVILGIAVFAGLWWLQDKTRAGAIVRAGMDDKEMTLALGVNYGTVCSVVFALGSALVGLAGFLSGPISGVHPEMAWDILPLALIVVVVGGVGSVQGAFLGAIVIGLIETFGKVYFPALAQYAIYIALVAMLLVKPSGFLGRRA